MGIVAVVVAVLALSFGDAVIKEFSVDLSLWQLFVVRSAVAVPILLGVVRARRTSLRVAAPAWVVVRCALLVAMWIAYYAALPLMPLSLASAAYYTSPLFIVALSALVAKQRPGRIAAVAVAVGFAGVALILRPDPSGFDAATLLPVLAAVLYAAAMVLTSTKCRNEDPIALAAWLNIAFLPAGAALGLAASDDSSSFVLGPWTPVDVTVVGVAVVLGACIVIGSVGAAIAYQAAPADVVAPFDYSYLVFSLAWGAIFFAEFPGAVSLAGVGLVAAGGVLATRSDTSVDADAGIGVVPSATQR